MIAILWSEKARKDFLNTIEYIALSSPQNASLVGDRIEEAISSLQRLPTGKKGRVLETYEKKVSKTSLIIVYEIKSKTKIVIIRVYSKNNTPSL